jgi:hypothetical protein
MLGPRGAGKYETRTQTRRLAERKMAQVKETSIAAITAITVGGYKSIRDKQRIEIRPLTILAGANSSGKSSIMQPLLLLKQTLESPFDPGPLLLDGPNLRLTSVEQVLCRIPGKVAETFSVGLEIGNIMVDLTYQKAPRGGIEIRSMGYADPSGSATLSLGMSARQVREAVTGELADWFRGQPDWQVVRDWCFLYLTRGPYRPTLPGEPSHPFAYFFATAFIPCVKAAIHLPGLRGNPKRTYRRAAVGSVFPGLFHEYVASVISHWTSAEPGKLGLLRQALEELGLTWRVEARAVDDTQVELRVGRTPHSKKRGAKDLVSIADVGLGVSQALPVVVGLLAAEPDQLLYLEQPEIHLHPRAQRRMAHLLAAAAKRGVRVVAETHSSLLLREIQTLVAKGEFDPKDLRLHWFTRGADGATNVSTAELDENGAYGDWPEDFDDVAMASEKDYLDAVESKGAGNE